MKARLEILLLLAALIGSAFTGSEWITLSSGQFEKIFQDQESIYKKSGSYSLNIKHASFQDHTSIVPYEQVDGYIRRDGNNYHSLVLGIQTVQNAKMKLEIDSADKSILIAAPDKTFEPISMDDLKKSVSGCSAIKTRVLDKGNAYRVEYGTKSSLESTEYFTETSGLINKMVLYYKEMNYDPGYRERIEKFKPRIEVVFSDFKTGVKFNFKDEFDDAKYVVFANSKYSGTGKYRDYHVFDTRPPKK
jgi:hypothetical protein